MGKEITPIAQLDNPKESRIDKKYLVLKYELEILPGNSTKVGVRFRAIRPVK